MFRFYKILQELDKLDEFKFEKKLGILQKLNPRIALPLMKAKKDVKQSWEARARMRNPERAKELFKGSSSVSGKRASSFLGSVYRASRAVEKKDKVKAQQAIAKAESLDMFLDCIQK